MLKMHDWITIKTLKELGHNKSRIARDLSISRTTVIEVLKKLDKGVTEPKRKEEETIIEQYKGYIEAKVSRGLTAVRIYQDLIKERSYTGSYETVKKYVRKVKQSKDIYMHNLTIPAEEAQVDFGYAGLILDTDGKMKKAWVFCYELTYSDKSFYKTVFSQDVKTFLECHIDAFKKTGGVPRIIKIDNLKSAILKASFYETEYQKEYLKFANYYGFLPIPCRIATPTDKASIETAVKYVKNNFFKGRFFKDITDCNRQLEDWTDNICNKRLHGTKKHIPDEIFEKEEKHLLKPLPETDYSISVWIKRTVSNICHICYESNFYSVPYEYVHKEVIVEDTSKLIKIYHDDKLVAIHQKLKGKGQYQTNNKHYPQYKDISTTEYREKYQFKMKEIGLNAEKYFIEIVNRQSRWWSSTIKGILQLAKEYGRETVDNACKRALAFDVYGYKIIKTICENDLSFIPYEDSKYEVKRSNTGEFSRSLEEYDKWLT